MLATFREFQDILIRNVSNARFWVIMIAMILLFAVIGPFGTFERMPLLQRFIYWSVAMLGSWAIAIVTISVLLIFAKDDRPGSQLVFMLGGAVVATFPMAAYLYYLIPLIINIPTNIGYWNQFLYGLPISLAFSLIAYFAMSDSSADEETSELDNALQKRLPPDKRGPILHMSMQDHYISVTTSRGKELILMRMADAVAALSGQGGLQIHRSHWVAKNAVVDSKRENGQPIVVLSDKTELPVSRSFTKTAREAGII